MSLREFRLPSLRDKLEVEVEKVEEMVEREEKKALKGRKIIKKKSKKQ